MKKLALLVLLALIAATSWAYDFSAVAPSGHTLYYNFSDSRNVRVTYQHNGTYAYSDLSGSLVIPESVTYCGSTYMVSGIGNYAFQNCRGLTSVTIPNSVTRIYSYAFSGCIGLINVAVPNSVTEINNNAFDLVRNITYYGAAIGMPWGALCMNGHIEGYLVYTDNTRTNLIGCSPLATSVTIPNSVTSIGSYAFYGCSNLTSITIPNSVTSIGSSTFYGCSSLASVIIPNSVTSIGNSAFYGCSNLTDIDFGHSVALIGSFAFRYCDSLTSVTIPNSVTHIGDYAFYSCGNLTNIAMEGGVPPTLGVGVFDDNANERIFIIPCGSMSTFCSAYEWTSYHNYFRERGADILLSIIVDSTKGSALIIQQNGLNVSCDSSAIIRANPNYGYHFDHWSTGSNQAFDTIHLDRDSVITAYFAPNRYMVTIHSNDDLQGNVIGGGEFDYLDTITLTAIPTDHHHMVSWLDGGTENPRQIVVTSDTMLTAYFAIDTHSVVVVSNDPTRGMIASSGSEFEYLSPCTVTATAYTGFVFTGWSNGVTANPYTFAVQNDVELTAIFAAEDEVVTITVESDDITMGSVSGGGIAMSGGEVTIHALANEGYHFVRWNDNDTNADRTITVTADATYTAYFAANQTGGIDDVEQATEISVRGNSIAVSHAQSQILTIFDIQGRVIVRELAMDGKLYNMPHSGVYMVQVGSHPVRKVVVIR